MISKKKLLLLLQILLVGITIFNIASVAYKEKETYFNTTYWKRFPSLQTVFLSSQYVNKHPKGWIPDETAFSYAAGMLIRGTNPVLVVPDAPPLGKYLIGLSAVVFGNENSANLLSAFLALLLLYLLSRQVLGNSILALLPPFLLSFEKMYTNQLIYTPLLDLFQLVFLLTGFYLFNKALQSTRNFWKYILAAGIAIGCFMSTKFFISGIPILFSWFVVLGIQKKWKLLVPASVSSVIALVLVPLSYVRVFAFGYSFKAFLGIQKWVFLYHKGQLILPLSVWPLLLLNRWHVWFGNSPVIHDDQWSITWPILMGILLLAGILVCLKKIPAKKEILLLLIWPWMYLLSLSFGNIFSRYFIILIPILYVVAIYTGQQLYNKIKKS